MNNGDQQPRSNPDQPATENPTDAERSNVLSDEQLDEVSAGQEMKNKLPAA